MNAMKRRRLQRPWGSACPGTVSRFGIGSYVLGIRTHSVHVAGQFVAQELRGVVASRWYIMTSLRRELRLLGLMSDAVAGQNHQRRHVIESGAGNRALISYPSPGYYVHLGYPLAGRGSAGRGEGSHRSRDLSQHPPRGTRAREIGHAAHGQRFHSPCPASMLVLRAGETIERS